MRDMLDGLTLLGIDMLSFGVVGIPMLLGLFLPVLRTKSQEKRWLLILFSL